MPRVAQAAVIRSRQLRSLLTCAVLDIHSDSAAVGFSTCYSIWKQRSNLITNWAELSADIEAMKIRLWRPRSNCCEAPSVKLLFLVLLVSLTNNPYVNGLQLLVLKLGHRFNRISVIIKAENEAEIAKQNRYTVKYRHIPLLLVLITGYRRNEWM